MESAADIGCRLASGSDRFKAKTARLRKVKA